MGARDSRLRRLFTWQGMAAAFGWFGSALILLITSIPIALLPITTGVPIVSCVVIGLLQLAIVGGVIVRRRSRWVRMKALSGGVALAVLSVLASQSYAATPSIRNADGTAPQGSIAALERVVLNGTEQWITIRGRNTDNPVLLNLGMGGPGGGGFASRATFEPLEAHFTVVSWDEPGTGKSVSAVPPSRLTRERFVEDARALTDLLRARFKKDQVFLYGVSWTSILGIWLIQKYPDRYRAFISSGQMVNTVENDQRGYQLALEHSRDVGDGVKVDELQRNGPPPYRGEDIVGRYVAYLDVLNVYMGSPALSQVVPLVPFLAPEYGYVDKVNHTRGLIDSFNAVYPQLEDLDLLTQAGQLDVPVYFFVGKRDVNAFSDIAERYYRALRARHKDLIWLEGGHGLNAESRAQFVDVMVHRVLNRER